MLRNVETIISRVFGDRTGYFWPDVETKSKHDSCKARDCLRRRFNVCNTETTVFLCVLQYVIGKFSSCVVGDKKCLWHYDKKDDSREARDHCSRQHVDIHKNETAACC